MNGKEQVILNFLEGRHFGLGMESDEADTSKMPQCKAKRVMCWM